MEDPWGGCSRSHSVSTAEGYAVNENRIFVVVLIPSFPVFTDTYVQRLRVKAGHIQWKRWDTEDAVGWEVPLVPPGPLSLCRNAAGNWVRASGAGWAGIACGAVRGSLRSRRHSRRTVTSFCILS